MGLCKMQTKLLDIIVHFIFFYTTEKMDFWSEVLTYIKILSLQCKKIKIFSVLVFPLKIITNWLKE